MFGNRKRREERKQHEVVVALREACSEESPDLQSIRLIVEKYPSAVKVPSQDGEIAMHLVCLRGGPIECVEFLYMAYPGGLREKSGRDWIPLHFACFGAASLEIIEFLVEHLWDSVRALDHRQRLPLHLACFRGASLDIIQYLVDQYPQSVQQTDTGGSLVLHLACDNKAPLSVVQWLVQQWPESVQKANNYGSLPLHRACFSGAPTEVIHFLIFEYPEGCRSTTSDGALPLHLASASGAPLTVIRALVQEWPESIGITDNNGKTPLDMAQNPFKFSDASPHVVAYLQQAQEGSPQVPSPTSPRAFPQVQSPKPQSQSLSAFLKSPGTRPALLHANSAPPTTFQSPRTDPAMLRTNKSAPTIPQTITTPNFKKEILSPHSMPTPKMQTPPAMMYGKIRLKIRDTVSGKRDKPVRVPPKYVENILLQDSQKALLAKGFSGVVWKATDPVISQEFAIKRMDRDIMVDGSKEELEQMKRSFKREQRALLSYRHPNLALLYAYAISENHKGHYLLYQLAEKGSLDVFWHSDLGRERLASFPRRAQIALDALIGLRFLHLGNQQVKPSFHRDIKSANIVLRKDLTAQWIDCGLASFVHQDQTSPRTAATSTVVKGTRGYVCPKYVTGTISYDESSDIFSFGVVLAELWSGRLQNHLTAEGTMYNYYEQYIDFEERTMEDDLDPALGFGVSGRLPQYMRDFKDLALACMARNPKRRPKGEYVMVRLERIWEASKQALFLDGLSEDISKITQEDDSLHDDGTVNEALQLVSCANDTLAEQHACRLCRTYANEVGHEECPLCLALQQERLRIAKAVSDKLEAKSEVPARDLNMMHIENRSLHSIKSSKHHTKMPLVARLDSRLDNQIPRLFVLVPADLRSGWKHPKTWLRRHVATRYHLYFICGHTYQVIRPPIKLVVSNVWVEKIAPVLGVALTLLKKAARRGKKISLQLGTLTISIMDLSSEASNELSSHSELELNSDRLTEMLDEVKDILDKQDEREGHDILDRIRSGKKLSEDDLDKLNGEAFELLVEKAREDRLWRSAMEPVKKVGQGSIFWVSKSAALLHENEYEVVEV